MEHELAAMWERLLAGVIDLAMVYIFNFILFGITGQAAFSASVTLGVWIVYSWYYWTYNDGQTPGKSLLNLRVVKTDGSRINGTEAIIRQAGYVTSALPFLMGFVWIFYDDKRQAWHDKLVGTVVIHTHPTSLKNGKAKETSAS